MMEAIGSMLPATVPVLIGASILGNGSTGSAAR
jgi:hypothetical protein